MSLENSIKRLTYRSSRETTRFAWKTVILSTVFGSAVFIIVPLTTVKHVKEEKTLLLRDAPAQAEIKLPEKEKIYEPKNTVSKKKTIEEIEPVTPSVPTPRAVPVPLTVSKVQTDFKLDINHTLNTSVDFNVEKIQVIDTKAEKPVEVKTVTPVKAPPAKNYNATFSKDEVDSDAQVINQIDPDYPRSALRRGIKGFVVIKCIVTKEGNIIQAVVTKAKPVGIFEKNCLEVLDKMKYKPAMLDGRPVAQRMELTFEFGF